MSDNNRERRGRLDKRVILFFVFAVACVAAFLIVILVKSCDADHEEKIEEKVLQQEIGMVTSSENLMMLA